MGDKKKTKNEKRAKIGRPTTTTTKAFAHFLVVGTTAFLSFPVIGSPPPHTPLFFSLSLFFSFFLGFLLSVVRSLSRLRFFRMPAVETIQISARKSFFFPERSFGTAADPRRKKRFPLFFSLPLLPFVSLACLLSPSRKKRNHHKKYL